MYQNNHNGDFVYSEWKKKKVRVHLFSRIFFDRVIVYGKFARKES